jgi:hypothetical protein
VHVSCGKEQCYSIVCFEAEWRFYSDPDFKSILTSSIRASSSLGPRVHKTESLARSQVAAVIDLSRK